MGRRVRFRDSHPMMDGTYTPSELILVVGTESPQRVIIGDRKHVVLSTSQQDHLLLTERGDTSGESLRLLFHLLAETDNTARITERAPRKHLAIRCEHRGERVGADHLCGVAVVVGSINGSSCNSVRYQWS